MTLETRHRSSKNALHAGKAEEKEPWYIGFQMNERYLKWGESGQARFLKIHCAKELGWSHERVRHCCATHIERF